MKTALFAITLVILAGCAELQQQAAQGGTAPSTGYSRQYNNGYPYNSPYGM
jgi:hypothetical protein